MFVHVSTLQHWKSEHTAQSCEDAAGSRPQDGLFAVADGVGTTLFSGIWARCLVETFLDMPLLSDDPFEMEWWLREAMQRYSRQLPSTAHMPWNVQQKVLTQGSYSTLAGVRFQAITANQAYATLLACGDSCIFVRQPSSPRLMVFPPLQPADFAQPPLSLPSKLTDFQRHFHRATIRQTILQAGSTLILATDAVAHWLIASGPADSPTRQHAFNMLAAQTPATWAEFVRTQRLAQTLSDDDCTALILTLHATPSYDVLVPLGTTSVHHPAIRAQRKQAFIQAVEAQHKELIAILFGDGRDLAAEGLALATGQLQHARQVADALHTVLQTVRREIAGPNAKERILPIWRVNAPLLANEPCAASLRETLRRLDIALFPDGIARNAPAPLQNVSKEAVSASQSNVPEVERSILPGIPLKKTEPPIARIREEDFRKACRVKQAYLFHTTVTRLAPDLLEQSTLDDLVSAPLIAAGIEQANKAGALPPLLAELLLPTIFEEFKHDRHAGYEKLLQEDHLSEEEIKSILHLLLNRKLFEEYLLWEQSKQLDDWLAEKSGDPAQFRRHLLQVCPWVVKLRWWREYQYA